MEKINRTRTDWVNCTKNWVRGKAWFYFEM